MKHIKGEYTTCQQRQVKCVITTQKLTKTFVVVQDNQLDSRSSSSEP